jgi:hypothetical protein
LFNSTNLWFLRGTPRIIVPGKGIDMSTRPTRRELLGGAAAVPFVSAVRAVAPVINPTSAGSEKPEAALPPIDSSALAKRIVRTFAPSAGERAILFFDQGYYPELAAATERELTAMGVDHFLAASFDPPEVVRSVESRGDSARRQEEFVAWLAPAFAKADLFLWLPARALYDDTRLEHLVGGSKVRGIHFHWIIRLGGLSVDDVRALSRLYQRVILETDYAALSKSQDRLIERLRGKALRLQSPDGTDLRLFIPENAWFHKNDGDMSAARAKTARCARDRSMELPAGALRFIPDPASVEGRLVVRRTHAADGRVEGLTLDFERGSVRRFRAAKGEEAFRREWEAIGGDIDKVGEIVLGTNPLLVSSEPGGEFSFYGYGAGGIRVSLGDNWESGGPLRTSGTRNWWLFLAEASLEAGDGVLVRKGTLLES